MGRIALRILALIGAIVALLVAILLPVHLRALDPRVLEEMGRFEQNDRSGKSLVQLAQENVSRNTPVAKLLLRAAEELQMDGTGEVVDVLRDATRVQPTVGSLFHELESNAAGLVQVQETPVLTVLKARENRARVLQYLHTPEALRILQNRSITNFAIFAPVGSGAGYPLEASILTTAYLVEQRAFGASAKTDGTIREEVMQMAARGISTNHVATLEEFYLNMFALSRRFSSGQLIAFVSNIQSYGALDRLTRFLQEHPKDMPIIFASVVVSQDGNRVAEYLKAFPETGLKDLSFGLAQGSRAFSMILLNQRPVYRAEWHNSIISSPGLSFLSKPLLHFGSAFPFLAHLLKWILLFAGGLGLAYSAQLIHGRAEEKQLEGWVPQFGWARRLVFAAVFLALMVMLGEPYLAQGQAEEKPAPRIRFSVLQAATAPPASTKTETSTGFMVNSSTLIAMGVFLVLQTSIYIFCLTKLTEIRRQPLSGPMKLKLLANEENLFDAGLYLGLFGTAASLILLTLGMIKPSLVSAYSSTLFGILFVALLKIFHVRPFRRKLIIESEGDEEAA